MDGICKTIMTVASSVCLFTNAMAAGSTYYLTSTEGRAFTGAAINAARWSDAGGSPSGADGDPLDGTAEYHVIGMKLRSLQGTTDFKGGSLHLGSLDPQAQGQFGHYAVANQPVTFENGGLFLYLGYYDFQGGPGQRGDTYGAMTVVDGGSFRFYSAYTGSVQYFHGVLVGSASSVISIGGSNCQPNTTYYFDGDGSGFKGTMDLAAGRVGGVGGQFTMTGISSMPDANVQVGTGAGVTTSTRLSTTVRRLELRSGSTFFVNAGWEMSGGEVSASHGYFNVTEELVVNGKVTIRGDAGLVPPTGVSETIDLIVAPENVSIDKTSFEFVPFDDAVQFATLGVRTENGRDVLYLAFEPVVELIASDDFQLGNSGSTSAFDKPASWSDGKTPHAGTHYLVRANHETGAAQCLRSPVSATMTTFPGLSLTIARGCRMTEFRNGQTLWYSTLRLLDGSQYGLGQKTTTVYLNGDEIYFGPGSENLAVVNDACLWILGKLKGTGEMHFCGWDSGTSTAQGNFRIRGDDNSSFGGTMRISHARGNQNYATNNQKVRVFSSEDFGGALPSFNAKAVTLENFGRLITDVRKTGSATTIRLSPESNRGIFVNGSNGGVLQPDSANHTLQVDTQLTINGPLYKEGAGTLVLGGVVKFGSDAVDMPVLGLNTFNVNNGKVVVTAVDALNGLETSFAAGTVLVLRPNLADLELTRWGIRNVKATTPFSTVTGTIPLELDVSSIGSLSRESRVTIGVVTVPKAVAASVRTMLPTLNSPFLSHSCKIVEKEDEYADVVTFSVVFEPRGLVLLFR